MTFTVEFKYDGERAQIHYANEGKDVQIFSRNLESNTGKYPDAIDYIKLAVKDKKSTFIVDAEVVAWDVNKQCILPFQILSTRARKVGGILIIFINLIN
jgi:DNA ligase-1